MVPEISPLHETATTQPLCLVDFITLFFEATTAIKRVLAYQIEIEMKHAKLSKTAMAEKMRTIRTTLDRLLDPTNVSGTLQTLEKAALALGKSLKIELADSRH